MAHVGSARWTRRAFLASSAAFGLFALVSSTDTHRYANLGPSPSPGVLAQSANLAPASDTIASSSARATRSRTPNVLLLTIDTLRADRLGAYGFASAHTPVLDQFARESVRFDHAICQLPQTNPSHAALMTGQYASTNGVKVHMIDKIRPDAQTMATIFQTAGYQTAGIYSWVSLDPPFCGLNRGFETYEGYVINRGAVFSNPGLEQLAASYRQLKDQVPILNTADVALGASEDYEATLDGRADVTNQAVFDWLDSHVGQGPFFLWVHYFDPHYPYAPPVGYDHILGLDYRGSIDGSLDTIHKLQLGQLTPNPADLARLEELYQGEIAFVDAQFGDLLDHLTALGVKDTTIIAVTGDHGESFGEHGDWTHGWKAYETEIRVPLILRYPPRLPAGLAVTAPVQLIDLLPTFQDLTDVKATQLIQGTSMLPVIASSATGSTRVAFTEIADESFVSILTYGNWKMIRNDANGQLQLYNLAQDEAEQANQLNEDARLTAELTTRLLDLMKISGVSK